MGRCYFVNIMVKIQSSVLEKCPFWRMRLNFSILACNSRLARPRLLHSDRVDVQGGIRCSWTHVRAVVVLLKLCRELQCCTAERRWLTPLATLCSLLDSRNPDETKLTEGLNGFQPRGRCVSRVFTPKISMEESNAWQGNIFFLTA